jgi:hypothetical protein
MPKTILLAVIGSALSFAASASADGPVAEWRFDEGEGQKATDSASGRSDEIHGNFWYLPGVSGTGIKFDGFTTRVVRDAKDAPLLEDAFSIEAWIAPQAFPWNWCAIVNQEKDHKAGYFFGIDDVGHVGLHMSIDGRWVECTSDKRVPFMEKWSHVAGTFREGEGITIYIDGEAVAQRAAKGSFERAKDVDLQIGRNHEKTLINPEALVRPDVNFPTPYSFDGIIDELKIHDRALSAHEIKRSYEATKPSDPPALEWRKLPELPAGDRRFGAVQCRLTFYREWDDLWRVADHPDIVVNFDQAPYKMVFWRGTNFNMNLVTENGKWVGDQSAEGGGGRVIGCCEHMSDKQCRYAHVRLIEDHDARVVVHWRYAVCDVLYRIANMHDGWGAWADEYYTIYPDGVATRFFTVYNMGGGCSITEPAALNNPGEKAEDNLEVEAVVMANMRGEIRAHSWDPWPSDGRVGAPFTNALRDANICVVNFKSKSKPYYIYEPGTVVMPYGGGMIELRPEYSKFPTWNHWPVSQAPSDGRYALEPDRVSSSAVTSPGPPMRRRAKDGALQGSFIMGLTTEPIEKLSPLARSWLQAPTLRVAGGSFRSDGYNKDQRAFVLSRSAPSGEALEIEIGASDESPLVNPAFVVKGWGEADAKIDVEGKPVERGSESRFGHTHTLEGTNLIVWLEMESSTATRIALSPVTQ